MSSNFRHQQIQLDLLAKLLKDIDLLEENNYFPSKIKGSLSLSKSLTYEELWSYFIDNSSYKFLLSDSSFFLYDINSNNPTYSYYGCPYVCLTYKDFLLNSGVDPYEAGDIFSHDYSIYLSQCSKTEYPISLRYDYDPTGYSEGVHPCSHIHIGIGCESRVGFKTILDPITFTLFIIRQLYPSKWFSLLGNNNYLKLLKQYKSKMTLIDVKYFNEKDSWEHYLI